MLSAPDAVGIAIERYLEEKDGVQEALFEMPPAPRVVESAQPQPVVKRSTGIAAESYLGSCPECSTGSLSYEEGCVKCHICGFSECG